MTLFNSIKVTYKEKRGEGGTRLDCAYTNSLIAIDISSQLHSDSINDLNVTMSDGVVLEMEMRN